MTTLYKKEVDAVRYASMRDMDISNGSSVGVALFVQGCDFHCNGCFNIETWDINGGLEWNTESINKFFNILNRPYIKRCSILGGEPLHPNNIPDVFYLCKTIKEQYPSKTIWLYTGYTFEDIWMSNDIYNNLVTNTVANMDKLLRNNILKYIDVLIDGRYVQELRDITLPFRGSSNQRIIDVQKTLQEQKIVLFETET